MNERIRELIQRHERIQNLYEIGPVQRAEVEAFVEDVVRECVVHLHRRGVEGFGILEERDLKEHFGVE